MSDVPVQPNSPTFASFNPTNNEHVAFIKTHTDELINYLKNLDGISPDGNRRIALACTNYEQAAMWAVKALFS